VNIDSDVLECGSVLPLLDKPSEGSLRNASLLSRTFAQEFCDIEIHEVGVMKNDRFDRALDLVPLMTVRGDDVQNLTGNTMLVGERNAAERMSHLLSEFSLDHFSRCVLVLLERFAHVRQ